MNRSGELGPKRRLLRPTAFRVGFVLGLILTGGYLASELVHDLFREDPVREPRFEVVSFGEDVDRFGGLAVSIDGFNGSIAQTCRDGCDDLDVQIWPPEATAYAIHVVGAAGAAVIDQPVVAAIDRKFVTTRWRVKGDDRLFVETRQTVRAPDGRLVEQPPVPADAAKTN